MAKVVEAPKRRGRPPKVVGKKRGRPPGSGKKKAVMAVENPTVEEQDDLYCINLAVRGDLFVKVAKMLNTMGVNFLVN